MEECIFCKIANKEVPSETVFENDEIIAFKDIHPMTPVHILVIPKKHISSANDIMKEDVELMGRLVFQAKEIAHSLGISEGGYKLLFRVGENGGQEIKHVHLHLMGGAKLHEEIRAE